MSDAAVGDAAGESCARRAGEARAAVPSRPHADAPARRLRLKKGTPGEVRAPASTQAPAGHTEGPRIRCPRCRWQPGRDARWSCECLHEWHTFDTGGVCPACGRVWADTQCLRCEQWSPHLAWYDTTSSDGAA